MGQGATNPLAASLQRGRRPSSSESLSGAVDSPRAQSMLQRGRRPSSSERRRARGRRRRRGHASTGPTTFVVGEAGSMSSDDASPVCFNGADDLRRRRGRAEAGRLEVDDGASTGPTTFVVGESFRSARPRGPRSRFNGADDLRRRRAAPAARASWSATSLQRGRRPSSSERPTCAPYSNLPTIASTGPTTFVVGEIASYRLITSLPMLLQRGRRPSSSESAGERIIRVHGKECFNGADDLRRRRASR